MFGLFRSRPKFNGTVDTKLNNEYQINTRREPFPGPMAFLKILDVAWGADMNEDEAAMYVATLFFVGVLRSGDEEGAEALLDRLNQVGDFGVSHGMIAKHKHEKFRAAIDAAIDEHFSKPTR